MKGLLIVAAVSFVAIRYLFMPGFLPTHDGEYHLIRFYEFEKMLADGHLVPRWAPGLNSGYGIPLFTFFYPLPNYFGSLFHFLGWSLADAFRLTMAVGYVTGIVASFFWLKKMYGTFPAVAGSIIGAFTPYWFVDLFVRGSVGEVLALGFVFVSLASIAYRKKTLLALAVAAIMVSHNILAMIFLPIIFLYVWITDRSMVWAIPAGIILASYFWIPAFVERRYVVGLNTVSYKDHFSELGQILIPSWGTGLSGPGFALDEMSYQIGIVPMLITVSLLVLYGYRMVTRQARNDKATLLLFLMVVGISFFLMLEISLPIWERIPMLANLQYPWRLLSVIIVATPFLAAKLASHLPRLASFALAGLAVIVSFSYTKPVLYAPRSDDYYLSRREFTDSTSSLGNGFSTRWMVWQPDRSRQRMEIVSGEGSIAMKQERMTTFESEVASTTDVTVRTNVAYYPGWRTAIDGKDVSTGPDPQGTISVGIDKGRHNLKVYFSETPLRYTANLVSLVCLSWLLGSTILKSVYEYRHRHYSTSNRS